MWRWSRAVKAPHSVVSRFGARTRMPMETSEPGREGLKMSDDPHGFLLQIAVVLICTLGGFRFRHWAVEGRDRVPRYSPTVETIVCWSIYSVLVSFCVFWGRHWLFEYQQLTLQ